MVDSIVEAVEDYDALLVGPHGRTGLARFFLGSVAEAVARACPVPVVVQRVRAPAR